MKKLIALHVAGWVLALSFFVIPVFFVGFTNKVIYTIASFLLYIGVFYINLLLLSFGINCNKFLLNEFIT